MKKLLLLISGIGLCFNSQGQQLPDTSYSPPSFKPAFLRTAKPPVVMIDEAHHNFHTAGGRYAPFAKLLRADGFEIVAGTSAFSDSTLRNTAVLVIANALHETNRQQWRLPTPSALTAQEIAVVNKWVHEGGSLFLIADHMPFPGAAVELASSFGFTFYNGFAVDTTAPRGADIFTRQGGGLKKSNILPVRVPDTIASFTGQAFDIPAEAASILTLHDRYHLLLPQQAWQFDSTTTWINAAGKSQGAVMRYGKGKIAVFGEAAMFSAQTAGNQKIGMNSEVGKNNYLLLLALMRWLGTRG